MITKHTVKPLIWGFYLIPGIGKLPEIKLKNKNFHGCRGQWESYLVTATAQTMVSLWRSCRPRVSRWMAWPEEALHTRMLSIPPVTNRLSSRCHATDRIRPTEEFFFKFRTEHNGHHCAEDIFNCIFSKKIVFWLQFHPIFPMHSVDNKSLLVQVMVKHHTLKTGDKPLPGPTVIYASLCPNRLTLCHLRAELFFNKHTCMFLLYIMPWLP